MCKSKKFKNYANVCGLSPAPSKPNVNEFMILDTSDTIDWVIKGSKMICKNPGLWQITMLYQLSGLGIDTENAAPLNSVVCLDGWMSINGVNVSDSTSSVNNQIGSYNVMPAYITYEFKKNDYIEFGAAYYNQKYPVVCAQFKPTNTCT